MAEVGEPAREPLKILRRHGLAEPGEPDQISEGDRHLPRARKRRPGRPFRRIDRLGLHRVPKLEKQHLLDHRTE